MKTVWKVFNKETGEFMTAYSRAYHDQEDFESESNARYARCDGEFKKDKYDVAEYEVIYKRIETR